MRTGPALRQVVGYLGVGHVEPVGEANADERDEHRQGHQPKLGRARHLGRFTPRGLSTLSRRAEALRRARRLPRRVDALRDA